MFAQWEWQNPLPQGNSLFDLNVFDSQNAIMVGRMGTVIKTSDGVSVINLCANNYLGLSNNPKIFNKVDFPHPDGPIIDTNSPSFTSKLILFKAVVSTSSVINILTKLFVLIILLSLIYSSDSINFSISPNDSYEDVITLSPGFNPSKTSNTSEF